MHCDWLRDAAWSWLITAATWIAAGAFSAVLEWISVRVGQQMRRDWRSIVKEHLLPRLLYWSGSRGARKQLLALVAAGTFVALASAEEVPRREVAKLDARRFGREMAYCRTRASLLEDPSSAHCFNGHGTPTVEILGAVSQHFYATLVGLEPGCSFH